VCRAGYWGFFVHSVPCTHFRPVERFRPLWNRFHVDMCVSGQPPPTVKPRTPHGQSASFPPLCMPHAVHAPPARAAVSVCLTPWHMHHTRTHMPPHACPLMHGTHTPRMGTSRRPGIRARHPLCTRTYRGYGCAPRDCREPTHTPPISGLGLVGIPRLFLTLAPRIGKSSLARQPRRTAAHLEQMT
jgi:hypothetical protein